MELATTTLGNLAERINDEHRRCEESVRASLVHAQTAGVLLLEAKAAVPHGAWGSWLADNVACSARTAQAYMRIARQWATLAEANPQRVADLSLRDALRFLSTPALSAESDEPTTDLGPLPPQDRDRRPFESLPPDARRELVTEWPGIRIAYALLFDALGWPVEKIAALMGIDVEPVRRVVRPDPPVRPDAGPAFTALVDAEVAWGIAHGYDIAAYRASQEGKPDLAAKLEARAAQHWARFRAVHCTRHHHTAFDRQVALYEEVGPDAWPEAFVQAITDYRVAVGIDDARAA